ncbi:hypothetical protein wVul_0208 [Wolbachia endosymbiont of Armadillidium vulgare str. wVulC]|nr:hypothetical protein wVul_0208 [Wolbachia endosymbiont of Armadillidium vulgare str. wVulC]
MNKIFQVVAATLAVKNNLQLKKILFEKQYNLISLFTL